MKRLSRRSLLASAAATAACGAFAPAVLGAAPVIFQGKVGSSDIQTANPIAIRSNEAFKAIEQETDGAVKIQLFSNDVLGSNSSQLTQLRTGAIQFMFIGGAGLSAIKPLLGLEGVGFLFSSYRELFTAYDGPLGKRLRAEFNDSGLLAVGKSFAGGPLHVMTYPRAVHTPDDLKGLKIRTSEAKTVIDAFSTLGATPTPTAQTEVYTAAQTHLIDGFSSLLQVIENQRLFETQKYLALTSHSWVNYYLMANADTWRSLPDKIKDVIGRNIDKAATLQRRDDESSQPVLAMKLAGQGISVNTIDPKVFRARLASYYVNQKAVFGAEIWGMAESVVGKLG